MFRKLNSRVKTILLIQAACMLIGTSTHVLWVMRHGLLYADARFTIYTTIFWNSLTFLDPFAAILLLTKPKAGVLLTAVVIIADVLHNAFVTNLVQPFSQTSLHGWLFKNQFLVLQCIFCIFVLSTLRINLAEIKVRGKDNRLI